MMHVGGVVEAFSFCFLIMPPPPGTELEMVEMLRKLTAVTA